ncbi:radical SAM protein [Candidatus Woesearchaeota archaeon]|nr:radical SAM protein [Candidatus Woesearchaeota archaeon]
MKVVLLAPPGNKVYMRDLYCSTTSKGEYYWPPSDLLIQSGILRNNFELGVLDAIAEKITPEDALKKLIEMKPDAIYSLGSSISLHEDMPFLKKAKEATGCKLVMSGDIFFFNTMEMMKKFDFIDGIHLCYISDDSAKFLRGEYEDLKNFCYRKDGEIIMAKMENPKDYKHAPQTVELFPYNKYSYPFMRRKPVTAFHTNFGCVYNCAFCNTGLINFSFRDSDNAIEEMRYLKSKGIRELFVKDATFNTSITRTKDFLRKMIAENFGFTWSCSQVVHNVDEELLNLMKQAGCHTILFGVESGSGKILKDMHKHSTPEKNLKTFEICDKLKMRTMGHFILGFPTDTEETIEETIAFAKKIKATFASFNLYVPRVGSNTREQVLGTKDIIDDVSMLDSSGADIKSYCAVPTEDLMKLRKKAYVSFYTDPRQMVRILSSVRSPTESIVLAKNFVKIFTKY